jgi:hypothetical protein
MLGNVLVCAGWLVVFTVSYLSVLWLIVKVLEVTVWRKTGWKPRESPPEEVVRLERLDAREGGSMYANLTKPYLVDVERAVLRAPKSEGFIREAFGPDEPVYPCGETLQEVGNVQKGRMHVISKRGVEVGREGGDLDVPRATHMFIDIKALTRLDLFESVFDWGP